MFGSVMFLLFNSAIASVNFLSKELVNGLRNCYVRTIWTFFTLPNFILSM